MFVSRIADARAPFLATTFEPSPWSTDEVKTVPRVQKIKRTVEYPLVTAVFAPSVVMLVDIGPVDASYRQVLPLGAGMQDIEDMVEYPVVRESRSLPSGTYREVRPDISVKLFTRDLCRQCVVYFGCPLRFLRSSVLLCFHKKRLQ